MFGRLWLFNVYPEWFRLRPKYAGSDDSGYDTALGFDELFLSAYSAYRCLLGCEVLDALKLH